MKVLIHQQFHLGHHYQFVQCLLPELAKVADVIVAVTPQGRQSIEFSTFLEPFSDRVRFDASVPEASPWLPLKERLQIHRDMRATVRRIRPDYVLMPSGDAQATAMGLYAVCGLGAVPRHVPCEVGIHLGTGNVADASAKTRLKDSLNRLSLAASGLKRVHLINLLFYEQARASGGRLARTAVLMPSPTPANPCLSKVESRRRLNLPEEGRYMGLAASMDSRKAIPEWLAAFREVSRHNERVLLAGWMNASNLRVIEESFADLTTTGKLIVRNGFMDHATYQTVLTALDVVCTPYPRFAGLSATLLEGVAAGRPVLANAYGWSGAIVERFNLGWTCNVLDHGEFSTTIRRALDEADLPRDSEARRRLMSFNSPANFAASWTQGVCEALGAETPFVRSWEWVLEGGD
jgi:glycosyltransferase involved in cell wall biosynthesis